MNFLLFSPEKILLYINFPYRKEVNMKIVLVAQNSSYTHTNPAVRIFSCALSEKHEAEIVETTVNDPGGELALCEKLYDKKADMYAFSVYIWNRARQLNTAKMIKKLLPDSIIVVGGPEVSFEDDTFFEENSYIDFLIKGEGERAICDIADGKYTSRQIIDAGIFDEFSSCDEPYFCSSHPAGCDDGKLLYYESSRGCPYHCSYCLSSTKRAGEKVRAKDSEKVKEELSVLLTKPVKAIKFVDRTFNFDIKRAKDIFSYIISFDKASGGKCPTCHFEICASLIDDETVDILSQARKELVRFEIGVQTATSESLEEIGRRNDTEKIIENVKKLREKTKVTLHLDLICGLPYDSYEGIKKSFDMIYRYCDCLQMGFLKLLPGTKMRSKANDYGMEYLDFPPYTLYKSDTFSFEELRRLSEIAEIAESFSDRHGLFFGSTEYLISKFDSPFELYERLNCHFREKGNLSSKAKYAELYEFGKSILCADDAEMLKEHLRYDFILSNQGRPPMCIERIYDENERAELENIRKQTIHRLPKEKMQMFVPAIETHFFGFDCKKIYIVDRKNRTVEKRDRV